jgi:hypothetical protein
MAVTINGDGTISGVSVGGLPDGVVDSGTLATGIDATKLADGTVTNSKLQHINTLSSNAQTQINGAGGWHHLQGTTASTVAHVEFVSLFSNYNTICFVISGYDQGTNAAALYLITSTNGGSTYPTVNSTYDWSKINTSQSGNEHITDNGSSTGIHIPLCRTVFGSVLEHSADGGSQFVIYMCGHNDASTGTYFNWTSAWNDHGVQLNSTVGAGRTNAFADVDGVRFIPEAGHIRAGSFDCYGLVSS